jgi:hypothetical protein
MYPIEIEYGTDTMDAVQVNDEGSKLAVPLQNLIKSIFDIDSMKKVMLEFEVCEF